MLHCYALPLLFCMQQLLSLQRARLCENVPVELIINIPGSSSSSYVVCFVCCSAHALLHACYVQTLHAAAPIFYGSAFAEMCR